MKEIKEFCNFLEKKAAKEANCFPIDRYFINQYLPDILTFDRTEFLLINLERGSNTYTVQLLLCLPELWENIELEDLLEIIKKFTNIFSYYTLIEFTHKYIEVNIIEIILKMVSVQSTIKDNIINYLISSFYPNLIKGEADELFFSKEMYGVQPEDWIYTKQKLLLDKRIKPAITDLDELNMYVKSLSRYKSK
jgi:hypothetical protein